GPAVEGEVLPGTHQVLEVRRGIGGEVKAGVRVDEHGPCSVDPASAGPVIPGICGQPAGTSRCAGRFPASAFSSRRVPPAPPVAPRPSRSARHRRENAISPSARVLRAQIPRTRRGPVLSTMDGGRTDSGRTDGGRTGGGRVRMPASGVYVNEVPDGGVMVDR